MNDFERIATSPKFCQFEYIFIITPAIKATKLSHSELWGG